MTSTIEQPPLWTKVKVYLPHVLISVYALSLRHVQLSVTLWTVACQTPLSMEFSRQEFWNGVPFPTPGDLSNPGIEPTSLGSPVLTGRYFTTNWPPEKPKMRPTNAIIATVNHKNQRKDVQKSQVLSTCSLVPSRPISVPRSLIMLCFSMKGKVKATRPATENMSE